MEVPLLIMHHVPHPLMFPATSCPPCSRNHVLSLFLPHDYSDLLVGKAEHSEQRVINHVKNITRPVTKMHISFVTSSFPENQYPRPSRDLVHRDPAARSSGLITALLSPSHSLSLSAIRIAQPFKLFRSCHLHVFGQCRPHLIIECFGHLAQKRCYICLQPASRGPV